MLSKWVLRDLEEFYTGGVWTLERGEGGEGRTAGGVGGGGGWVGMTPRIRRLGGSPTLPAHLRRELLRLRSSPVLHHYNHLNLLPTPAEKNN